MMKSTSEKVVGTDIDCSAIYEKTYYADNINATSDFNLDANLNLTTVKRIVAFNESFFYESTWSANNLYYSGVDYVGIYARMNANGVQVVVRNKTLNAYHVTIQYVKA